MNESRKDVLARLKEGMEFVNKTDEVRIDAKDLRLLLGYVEELEKELLSAKGLADELRVGDKVEVLQMTVSLERHIELGEVGEVVEIQSEVFTAFPYAVMFEGVHFTTRFARNELRKVGV